MDELTEKASPYTKLTNEIKALREEQEQSNLDMIKLLGIICDLKEAQQASDDAFRKSWRNTKLISVAIVGFVTIAAYFDIIEMTRENEIVVELIRTLFG